MIFVTKKLRKISNWFFIYLFFILSRLQAWRGMWSNHWWCLLNIFFVKKPDILLHDGHLRVILLSLYVGIPVVTFDGVNNRVQHNEPKNVWVGPSRPPLHWSFDAYWNCCGVQFEGKKKIKSQWGWVVLCGTVFCCCDAHVGERWKWGFSGAEDCGVWFRKETEAWVVMWYSVLE